MSSENRPGRLSTPVIIGVVVAGGLVCLVAALCVGGFGLVALPTLIEQQPSRPNFPSTGATSQPTSPPPPLNTTPAPDSAYDTLEALNAAIIPPRDRLDLAERLLGLSPNDIVAPTPISYEVGDTEIFWADNSDTDEVFQVTAVLEYETPHLYMWVEQGADFDPDALAASAERFEEITYPTNHEYFGTEWSPGIDGDEHLNVLHSTVIGATVAGYYGSQHEYPAAAVPYSNEREIFFINVSNTRPGDSSYDGVLAHEFQHMIHWYVDRNEESWANEGLSELAEQLNGFEGSGFEFYFLTNPDHQLNNWPEDGDTFANYGAAYLYHAYFLDRFGDETLRALVRNPRNGMDGVQDTLREEGITDPETGQPITSEDFFADWVIANYVNHPALGDGRYVYDLLPSFQTASAADIKNRLPVEETGSVHQFGADYVQLPVAGQMRFTFDGSQQIGIVPTELHDTDGDPATDDRFVWSAVRGDDSDARLTVPLDLSGVDSATLDYDLWYFIEDNWDYAYVEVSEDGGQTWTILETPYTTTSDPHGNSYGPGYSGRSADQPGANADGWLHESLDLSDYGNQEILLRFEMLTDDAVNQPGLVIDNVRVDAIGFYDDAEEGSGAWEAEGFVRHDNVLPQNFVVQILALGNAPTLERMPLDENNHGQLVFEPGPGTDDVVLVVSATTSHTTELASYEYTVSEE